MTVNALCDTDTNKTIHRDHQFIVVPDPSWVACDGGSHRHLTARANEAGCLVDWEDRKKVRRDDAFGTNRSYPRILPKHLRKAAALLALCPCSSASACIGPEAAVKAIRSKAIAELVMTTTLTLLDGSGDDSGSPVTPEITQ
jgi:hypothetical protein